MMPVRGGARSEVYVAQLSPGAPANVIDLTLAPSSASVKNTHAPSPAALGKARAPADTDMGEAPKGPEVTMDQLFDLDPDSPLNQE